MVTTRALWAPVVEDPPEAPPDSVLLEFELERKADAADRYFAALEQERLDALCDAADRYHAMLEWEHLEAQAAAYDRSAETLAAENFATALSTRRRPAPATTCTRSRERRSRACRTTRRTTSSKTSSPDGPEPPPALAGHTHEEPGRRPVTAP